MTHGHTRIPSKGACIYCGAKDVPLTDEHVIPLSLGGQHILCEASCRACADITKKFEQDVARELWGDARNAYDAPSRRKKHRKTHIILTDPDNPTRTVKIPYKDYPAPMVFYKMDRAGLLEGLPEYADTSGLWEFSAVHDDVKAKQFEQKFGVKLTARFRNVPESFARLLAKIGYRLLRHAKKAEVIERERANHLTEHNEGDHCSRAKPWQHQYGNGYVDGA